jgi:hypothetical protein
MVEMIEPDRTIMIVSIIGLEIIWGSVAYRKFAQKGGSQTLSSAQTESSQETGQQGSDKAKSSKRRKNQ